MSAGRRFRVAFLDGEPPEAARRAAAQGTVELVDPSRPADPGRVDGVVIGGPIERRAERVTGHLRTGVAVLAAAPLSAEAAEHDALVQDAEEGAGRLLLAYRQRWRPEVAAVCAALEAGELGRTGLIRLHSWRVSEQGGETATAALRDAVDAVLRLAGTEPEVVHAAGDGACLLVHVGFAGGGMALLDLATSPAEPYDSLTVIGAEGAAHAEDHRNVQLLYDRRGLQGMPLRGDGELGLLRAFAGGARSGAAHERAVSEMAEAVTVSLRTGEAIAVAAP